MYVKRFPTAVQAIDIRYATLNETLNVQIATSGEIIRAHRSTTYVDAVYLLESG